MYDVAIIGAGISGAAIARELSRYALRIALLEKENDVSLGTTRANSAIVHAGYDARPGTMKARFCAAGNALYEDLCNELAVPFVRNGSLVAAFTEDELGKLEALMARGRENGVPGLEILDRARARQLVPNLADSVVGGLYASSAGIVGPWELTLALVENAVQNGVDLFLNAPVTALAPSDAGFQIHAGGQALAARLVINCAGLQADQIHRLLAPPPFTITPVRGEYLLFDKSAGGFTAQRTVFGVPGPQGKGVVLLPTAHGNLLLGPNAEAADSAENTETTAAGLDYIREYARKRFRDLPLREVITSFAGLRAKTEHGDFELGASEIPGFINVAGIASPGLTAAPAIARYVADLVAEQLGELAVKPDFQPQREPSPVFMELSPTEQAALLARDPRYGRVICRCEQITEGEIVAAIHRQPVATTVDAIKRRVRPGAGRCQGGFCLPRVMEILARELGRDMLSIYKDRQGSYILTGATKTGGEEA
ncbi:MAG: NAD(P)/FAD-dependent oxidoreductase [Firmicutes bacterium]|nr:NAD(P)/FAD-dependent oxidoreductase [Bacillota bacterium]